MRASAVKQPRQLLADQIRDRVGHDCPNCGADERMNLNGSPYVCGACGHEETK